MAKRRCKPSLTRCPLRGRNCCRPRNAGHNSSSDTRHGEEQTVRSSSNFYTKRKKDSYYKAQFFRLQSRRGPQKAICAVAASILTAIYHILKDGTEHHDLGSHHFDRHSAEGKTRRLVAQLIKLGFEVQLQRTAEAA